MLPLLGIIIGLIIGLFLDIDIPQAYSAYVAVLILAALDSLVGALLASLQKKFNTLLFVTGLLGNALIAVVLSALGDRLNIDLNLAAIFAFGVRIINNFSQVRRFWLHQISDRRRLARSMRDVIDSPIEEEFLDSGHDALLGTVPSDSSAMTAEEVTILAAEQELIPPQAEVLPQLSDAERIHQLEHEITQRLLVIEELRSKPVETADTTEAHEPEKTDRDTSIVID